MSIITTVKDKILINSILARIFAFGKDSRTKIVLARKIEKQGLGSTPGPKSGVFWAKNTIFSPFWHCLSNSKLNFYGSMYLIFRNWIKITPRNWNQHISAPPLIGYHSFSIASFLINNVNTVHVTVDGIRSSNDPTIKKTNLKMHVYPVHLVIQKL